MIKTILLVEDDVMLRNAFVKILVRADYDVLEADSAVEALQIYRSHEGTINLLIADSFLRTMAAPELIEQLRESWPDMKVLLIGSPSNLSGGEGNQIPNVWWLQKPFVPQALAEEVKTILWPSRGTDASALTSTA